MKSIQLAMLAIWVGLCFSITSCGRGGGGGGSSPISISGTVKEGGYGLPGVQLTLSGSSTGSATTDSNGNFTFNGITNGTYTVTPTLTDGSFSPSNRTVTVSGASSNGQNFSTVTTCYNLPYVGNASPSAYASVNRKLYLFGGWTPDPYGDIDTIRVFDLNLRTWSQMSYHMPYPISDAGTAIFINNHFYITPGFTTGEYAGWGSHNKIIDVDIGGGTAQETVTIPYGGAIWETVNCGANDKMYIFGGHNGQDQTGIFEYTPGAATMSKVANMGYAHRNGAVTLGTDGWMYIMGQSSQIERFNPTTDTVQTMNSALPAELIGIIGISANWHVPNEHAIYFAVGGYYSPVDNPSIYKFDYVADTLTNTGLHLSGKIAGGTQFNVGIRDSEDPYTTYFFKQGVDSNVPLKLCRTVIAP